MAVEPFGRVHVLPLEEIFESLLQRFADLSASGGGSVALSGGSTPKAFFRWLAASPGRLEQAAADNLVWTVSDERHVPTTDPESNFGNAAHDFLDPAGVGPEARLPWRTELDPGSCARDYGDRWAKRFGEGAAYDICLLGLGGDCHTASLFPGSPLLSGEHESFFAATEVPDRGWRLTITPGGLEACKNVLVVATGPTKADPLRRVFSPGEQPLETPSVILRTVADRLTWLLDPEAAALL